MANCAACTDFAVRIRNAESSLVLGAEETRGLAEDLAGRVHETAYGGALGGRGRRKLVKVKGRRGPFASPLLSADVLGACERWLAHLGKLRVRDVEALREHVEATTPAGPNGLRHVLDERVLPAYRRFLDGLAGRVPRKGFRRAARQLLGQLASVSEKAVAEAERRGWPSGWVRHEGVGMLPSRPGAPQVTLDVEGLAERMPAREQSGREPETRTIGPEEFAARRLQEAETEAALLRWIQEPEDPEEVGRRAVFAGLGRATGGDGDPQ